MYARTLSLSDFKCFGQAKLELQYPGREDQATFDLSNINLILGDNGGGKSSVLRGLAIAILAPALLEQGFVPYRLVRRLAAGDGPAFSLLKVNGVRERPGRPHITKKLQLLARLERRGNSSRDRFVLESNAKIPLDRLLFDDFSADFFVVGYGATRRVETGEFSESSARRSRGRRYQRIASLFEDHVALRPLAAWLERLREDEKSFKNAVYLLNAVLPPQLKFSGVFDREEEQYLFDFEGIPTPFTALSDGYKAFIGWVGDLIGHLTDVGKNARRLEDIAGIVLVDEIDLHLHPAWQREVVPSLSRVFPRLQFVFTSHSPLVASTVRRKNVFVTDTSEDGSATIKQLEEFTFGRSAEQLLLSSYFGLVSTRSEEFQSDAEKLFARVASGEAEAALEYLNRLTGAADAEAADGVQA
ncbi:MAG: AAA family ATPase [Oligoflexus sp.]|jgi:hypothetical protein|nr:AAA family ATPase [Aquidulcibacter sp.]